MVEPLCFMAFIEVCTLQNISLAWYLLLLPVAVLWLAQPFNFLLSQIVCQIPGQPLDSSFYTFCIAIFILRRPHEISTRSLTVLDNNIVQNVSLLLKLMFCCSPILSQPATILLAALQHTVLLKYKLHGMHVLEHDRLHVLSRNKRETSNLKFGTLTAWLSDFTWARRLIIVIMLATHSMHVRLVPCPCYSLPGTWALDL